MDLNWGVVVPPSDPKDADRLFNRWVEENSDLRAGLGAQDILKDTIRGLDGSMLVRYRVRRIHG